MDILVMAGQLILGLTILVGVHELGHMLTAKWFGMRVEKFSIGFPPKIFGKQIGETEYMLGAIPLGGFVKITGMVDESLDTEALKQEPQPYEFRAKPAWQRLIVMLGGIIVNVITGILIFSVITFLYGESYLPASEVRYGVVPNKLGEEMGFRTGDKIVKINGRPFTEFNDVLSADFIMGSDSYYTVERNNQLLDIPVPKNIPDLLADAEQEPFVRPQTPFTVKEVVPGLAASKGGLLAGDKIVKVGAKPVTYFHELQQALADYAVEKPQYSLWQRFIRWIKNEKALPSVPQTVPVMVVRDGQNVMLNIKVDETGKIGFQPDLKLNFATRYYSLPESVPQGAKQAFGVIALQAKAFGKIFRGEASASKSLGGPIEIAQQYGSTFDWLKFWTLTGMLSMVLAFMNLLPVPALDGGHVMFLTYEMISGRKPSDRFLENAQKVGMALILSLMVFVIIINPILKAIAD